MELTETEIQSLYTWIDTVKYTRPKRNITRDFSDGVSIAELVHFHLPKLIDLHNYSPANSTAQKLYNWNTLENKVFRRLGMKVAEEVIHAIVALKPGYIEYLLYELWGKIEEYQGREGRSADGPVKQVQARKSDTRKSEPKKPEIRFSQGELKKQASNESIRQNYSEGGMIGDYSKIAMPDSDYSRIPMLDKHTDPIVREMHETIKILHLKVTKLEELLSLKDMRINELTSTLEQFQKSH